MRTIYLHIGTMKTGTTTLQKLLTGNREHLNSQGYCYPNIQTGISERYRLRNGHFLIYPSDPEQPIPAESVVKEGFSQLREATEAFEKVILSDEVIWHQSLKQPGFWENLYAKTQEMNCDLKVIVYLRRQDHLAESLYNQIVKSKRMFYKTFAEFLDGKAIDQFALSYYEQISHIASCVGKENLLLRIYEDEQFAGAEQSLFSDFLEVLGLSREGIVIPDPASNLGLQGNYLELKRLINELPEYRQLDDFMSYPLRAASAVKTNRAIHPNESLFTVAQQMDFMNRFQEGNRRLAIEYLHRPDGVLFLEPLGNLSTWQLDSDTLYHDVAILAAETFCRQEKQLRELKTQLRELERTPNTFQSVYRKLKSLLPFKK